jgi:hypothetical protein
MNAGRKWVAAVGLSAMAVWAGEPAPFSGAGTPTPAGWSFADPGPDGVVNFRVTIPGFQAVRAGDGYVLRVPGQCIPYPQGAPDVPFVATVIPGSAGVAAEAKLADAAFQEFTNVTVAPVEAVRVDDPEAASPKLTRVRVRSPEIYNKPAFWPEDLVKVQEAWMGTQKLVRIEIHPVQYNPVSKTVRFYREFTGTLNFTGEARSPE